MAAAQIGERRDARTGVAAGLGGVVGGVEMAQRILDAAELAAGDRARVVRDEQVDRGARAVRNSSGE